jgi:IclR family transcriptional regulator, acetate operon repressor
VRNTHNVYAMRTKRMLAFRCVSALRPQSHRVQSVERAISVLRDVGFRSSAQGLTVSEVAGRTGLDRAVVRRLLKTLEGESFVISESGRFAIGPAAYGLGQTFADRHLARRLILPYAIDLHARLIDGRPWIVSISVPSEDRVVILDRIWGATTPLSLLLDIGTQFPIDQSASGRALLAAFEDKVGESVVGSARWGAIHPKIAEIRSNGGVSIAHGELRPGMSSVAVAIGSRPETAVSMVMAGVEFDDQARPDSLVARELRNVAEAAAFAVNSGQSTRTGSS